MNQNEINAFVAGLSEGDANRIFWQMGRTFGWGGGFFSRGDAESTWEDTYPDIPFTDDIWFAVYNTWEWRHLADCTDSDWIPVQMAIESAKETLDSL